MKPPKHTETAALVLDRLAGWGFPPEVQQRLGALAVVWGVFETSLESTLWALDGDEVKGERPWTDKTSIGVWIEEFGKPRSQFPGEANAVLQEASISASDLMEYRHSITHGWMLPSSTMPIFVRNPSWNGEQRKRPSHDAHVDANLLDMAIDSAWTLCQVVLAARDAYHDEKKIPKLLQLRAELARARSESSELRHLTELMNSDKY